MNIPGTLILKYSKACHRTVKLLYLIGPTILIYNLDVLKNAILFILLGVRAKGYLSNKPKFIIVTYSFPILSLKI